MHSRFAAGSAPTSAFAGMLSRAEAIFPRTLFRATFQSLSTSFREMTQSARRMGSVALGTAQGAEPRRRL